MRYECLEDIDVLELAKHNGVEQTVSEVVMSIKSKGIPLFYGIEQGTGKNSKNVYVYFKRIMAIEVKDWIQKNYGIKFIIPKKQEYKTSLPKLTGEEELYHRDLNDYILNRMKVITISSQKEIKQTSYLEELTGKSQSSKKSNNQSINSSDNEESNREKNSN